MATALNFAWDDAKPVKPPRRRFPYVVAALALASGLAACGKPLTDTEVAANIAARALSASVSSQVDGRDVAGGFAIHRVADLGDKRYEVCGVLTMPLSVDSEPFAVRVDGLEAGEVYTGEATSGACDHA